MKKITINDLLKSGAHFGHQTSRWNPKMNKYIFGKKDKVHILDIRKTKEKLEEAQEYVKKVVKGGGKVLFVGTKKQAKELVEKAAKSCGMPYVSERWLGGTLTNFDNIKKRIQELKNLEQEEKEDDFAKYIKKEKLQIKKNLEKLRKNLGGLKDLEKLPECLFVVDIMHNKLAVKEAGTKNIPIISLVDTNTDPTPISYPIPANDDAIASIELMLNAMADCVNDVNKK
jgi:small subunit ribosomal protein S2